MLKTSDVFTVIKLPEGGFLVQERDTSQDYPRVLLFACTHLDELTAYLRKKFTSE